MRLLLSWACDVSYPCVDLLSALNVLGIKKPPASRGLKVVLQLIIDSLSPLRLRVQNLRRHQQTS